MPFLKRPFSYKDDSKAIHVLKQGEEVNLEELPEFARKLLLSGNYLVEEQIVQPPQAPAPKKELPVKLATADNVKTFEIVKPAEASKQSSKKESASLLETPVVPNVVNKSSIKALEDAHSDIKVSSLPTDVNETKEASEVESPKKAEDIKVEVQEKPVTHNVNESKPSRSKKQEVQVLPVSQTINAETKEVAKIKEGTVITIVDVDTPVSEEGKLVVNQTPKPRPAGKRGGNNNNTPNSSPNRGGSSKKSKSKKSN